MSRVALKIVESLPFYRESLDVDGEEAHSLHRLVSISSMTSPALVRALIERYSKKGQVVLDPFCGSGTVPLEANLSKRITIASDINPLLVRLSRAKLSPADITEVTLYAQQVNLGRPVDLDEYDRYFSPFYDVDTYRELCNLRRFLLDREDRVSRFVQALTMGLLHGHNAGYFSTYTFPQLAVSPREQKELNLKRGQAPDARAVVPRLLRKTAGLFRDGFPQSVRDLAPCNRFGVADARDLGFIASGEADLVVTSLPLPHKWSVPGLWLKLWFAGMAADVAAGEDTHGEDLKSWKSFAHETLFELARVVKSGGRAAFITRVMAFKKNRVHLDEELRTIVDESLSKFWEPEGTLIAAHKTPRVKHKLREHDDVSDRNERVLILRRR